MKWWKIIIGVFAVFFIISLFFSDVEIGNVALIQLNGIILPDGSQSFFAEDLSSLDFVALLDKAEKNPSVEAVILQINSPGGTPVASLEIVEKIKSMEKPVYAQIREVGASGAYWVASATDKIYASPVSIVGSVGVNAAYLEVAELLNDYNVTYRSMTGGKYKDIGSPFKNLTVEEEARIQTKIDILHDYFLQDVINNRGLTQEQIQEIQQADYYVGIQSVELGLVDELGGLANVISYVEETHELEADIIVYKRDVSFLDSLSDLISEQSFFFGKGVSNGLLETDQHPVLLK